MRFTVDEFLKRLPLPPNEKWKEGVWDTKPFEKDGVSMVFFAPRGIDYQTFHDKDEFYFIARGTAELAIGNKRFSASVGDAFFVGAYEKHAFENMSDDFATWAVFF